MANETTGPDISTAAVERLLDGVTAGPWMARLNELPDMEDGSIEIDSSNWGAFARAVVKMDDEPELNREGCANARFIAASRDLVPALLADRDLISKDRDLISKDRDRLAAEVVRLRAERDAAMAGRVKVKPLVWEYISEGGRIQEAVGFNAVYKIWDRADGIVRWQKRQMAHWIVAASVDAAKAAAQADYEASILAAIQPDTERAEPVAFQGRVQPWMMTCFGPEVSGDRLERADRLLEEVLELLQSGAYTPERVASLTAYVWSRPVGEPAQEVGGVMVTLAAYCLAHNLDMHAAAEVELSRVWTKVDKIREKQAAKPKGSALPQAWPDTTPQPAPAPQARDIAVQAAPHSI